MSFDLTFSHPSWYIALCFLLGAVYAVVLYYRSRDIEYGARNSWLRYLLAFFRFVVASVLALLVLDPLLKYVSAYEEKPKIILAVDDSESIALQLDSAQREKLRADVAELKEALSGKFEVVSYTFGEAVAVNQDPEFRQRITNMGLMMEEVGKGWKGQNVSAMVLVSDGINNQGINPERIARNFDFPVLPVPLGDTSVRKDLAIVEIRSNAIAYLGNDFPLVVDVSGRKLKGRTYEVSLYAGDEKVKSQQAVIDEDDYFRSFEFQLEAKQTGTRQYLATVTVLEGEVNTLNNRSLAYVDVIDSRQKIMVLGSSPHPDLGAIKRSLAPVDNYELEVLVDSRPDLNTIAAKDASLVILHQIPSSSRDIPFIQRLISMKIPVLFILGRNTNITALINLDIGFGIRDYQASFNKALPDLADEFVLFELSPVTRETISAWPPLDVPFGKPDLAGGQSLLTQKIGRVNTAYPLMTFVNIDDWKAGMLMGEGFWQWSLQDYNINGNMEASSELLSKTVQYLSVRSDKRKFRVFPEKRVFYENDMIAFRAELYNESYESVNEPDVNLVLTRNDEQYEYVFSRGLTGYKLQAGILPAGEYAYRATTQLGGTRYSETGSFVIRELQKENLTLEADHGLLTRIAEASGGRMVSGDSIAQLAEWLNASQDLKPVVYNESSFREIINLKWIFFFLVMLLSMEWALRKWSGGY